MVNAHSIPCLDCAAGRTDKDNGAHRTEKASWLQRIGELSRHEAFDWLRHTAPPEALEDRDLLLAAVDACGAGVMHFAARELRRDRKFMLDAVELNGFALGAAASDLQVDRDFVLEAVARDADALGEVCPELQADHDVVLAAVSQKGSALRFAAPTVQTDREVLLTAAVQDPKVLLDPRIVKSTWVSNRGFVMAVVRRNGLALASVEPQFQAERDVVFAAVMQNGKALHFAAPWLQADIELARVATSQNSQVCTNDVSVRARIEKDLRAEN